MIRLGLDENDKRALIDDYVSSHSGIETVIVFSPEKFPLDCTYEQYGWKDIIMYKTFYPLLERINDHYLIVCNEVLRTKNRNDLTYNCLHHYLNQTHHRIVFQYFPIIDDVDDFMILLDNDHPGKFKGRGYDPSFLSDLDIDGKDRRPVIDIIRIPVSDASQYEKERDRLFDDLGNRDPETIPRHLHQWVAKYKKPHIVSTMEYIGLNTRFKLSNVSTFKDARDPGRICIDLPFRQMEINDWLFATKEDHIRFMATSLKVDDYYVNQLYEFNRKVGDLYNQAGICV